MVAVASFFFFVLLTASADADINPVVVPAKIGSSITKEVDANTQMIFEYKVLQSGAVYLSQGFADQILGSSPGTL